VLRNVAPPFFDVGWLHADVLDGDPSEELGNFLGAEGHKEEESEWRDSAEELGQCLISYSGDIGEGKAPVALLEDEEEDEDEDEDEDELRRSLVVSGAKKKCAASSGSPILPLRLRAAHQSGFA
jgi:hypothetical protein